jgi:hypothetical protein
VVVDGRVVESDGKSHLPSWPFQVPDEADHESVLRLYLEPVKPSPVRSDRVLLEPG